MIELHHEKNYEQNNADGGNEPGEKIFIPV
jgi:hypothetical protein